MPLSKYVRELKITVSAANAYILYRRLQGHKLKTIGDDINLSAGQVRERQMQAMRQLGRGVLMFESALKTERVKKRYGGDDAA